MDLTEDSPCIIGSSCRLPGGVSRTDSLWSIFNQGDWELCSTLPPISRGFSSFAQNESSNLPLRGRGGWLGEEGIECFDPKFFGISEAEGVTLRPNVRLALELTYEALEQAGIPPSSLRGKNVSISIGVGTEDGWDMKRWKEDGPNAFDKSWASNSDPSGVPGHIAHVFDFRGSCNTVSNACATGAFALRDGIYSLYGDGAEVAIVGSLTTHFTPAPFGWAISAGVASRSGRSSSFSPDADGYSPSEGAIFFILKKSSAAKAAGNDVQAILRALATGHNGTTRTLITPNVREQVAVTRRALDAAELKPSDVTLVEAHGTGTPVGDALEAEGIRSIYGERENGPLFVSSSKTVFGHCHGAAALLGVLKVISCFERESIPSHHVKPHPEFLKGSIIIPVEPTLLTGEKLIAQVNAFGFTGSVASIILERPLSDPPHPATPSLSSGPFPRYFFLPFSAKSPTALSAQICAICAWTLETGCTLRDLATVLGLSRDHHGHRIAVIANTPNDLIKLRDGSPHHDSSTPIVKSPNLAQCDDRVTAELLDLNSIDEKNFDNTFQRGRVDDLLEEGRILELACLLYEHGHTLSFSSIYDQFDVNREVLRSFPFYQFDRKRYWKDTPSPGAELSPYRSASTTHLSTSKTTASSSHESTFNSQSPKIILPVDQEYFQRLIETFGAPIDVPTIEKPPMDKPSSHFLLTGANGMLGAQLLSRLLQTSSVTVYCIVRGDPWERLCSSFSKHNLPVQLLHDSHARGSLQLMHTADLCGPRLGLSDGDYAVLIDSVEEIIHAAWNVNFNLPLAEFIPLLQSTRNLVEVCFSANKLVRFHFVGSYASTFNYDGELVPEKILKPRLLDSLAQGYAISKLIAENSLLRIHQAFPTSFHLSIIRVGQICGDTVAGLWSQNEMMPMIIASVPALRALPLNFPDVSWIPSDVCADALRDIVKSPRISEGMPSPQVLHLSNPQITPWPEIARHIGEIAGIGPPTLLPLKDYVDLVKQHDFPLPVSRLLPYFSKGLEEGTMPQKYASLEVSQSLRCSFALASCPPISSDLLTLIVRSIMKDQTKKPSNSLPPVFLFGAWTTSSNTATNNAVLRPNTTESRIMTLAGQVRLKCEYNPDVPDIMLEQQLKTLASQLTCVTTLREKGVIPGAVLGYCFGEYAAAITAGILTEETVVEILVYRAMGLRNINGAMLNVFDHIDTVRRSLASMSSPPSLAIIAGPTHMVLSGSNSQVECAETELRRRGVKTCPVNTNLPFHSTLMDVPAVNFVPVSCSPRNSHILYISGVTGAVLQGHRLGLKYWLRHMRDPVNFYGSMQYIRANFVGAPMIDIGPGLALTKIISRYSWPGFIALTPGDAKLCGITPARLRSHPSMTTSHSIAPPLTNTTTSDIPNILRMALELLDELFGYSPSVDLLSRSLHSIGLQSMDFIRFADHFGVKTGININLSAFVSDASLETIVREAK